MSYPGPYRRIGADNIMFAIDHPYQTTEAAVRFLDEAEISGEDRRKIYHRTPRGSSASRIARSLPMLNIDLTAGS
jgi:hypothetical protein